MATRTQRPPKTPTYQKQVQALPKRYARASAASPTIDAQGGFTQVDLQQPDLQTTAQHMYTLMLRNIASTGYVFIDPTNSDVKSLPGCVLAAPSYPANTPGVDQDYVFNWVRDAALTALELVAAHQPVEAGESVQALIDYVTFAQTCQKNATPTMGHACFTINGYARPWSEQNDGPALQSVAILAAFKLLDSATQTIAKDIITTNVAYLLEVYQQPTYNLWEEHSGQSFFARSAQLRCFQEIKANTYGIGVPADIDTAISWLQDALASHWNGSYYVSIMPPIDGNLSSLDFYDPNIDIISASVYGAIPCTDTKLLATAARLRSQWADDDSPEQYPINAADKAKGLGPLLGRYPGDIYDGDVAHSSLGRHPWALCTCNLAELYYRLANAIDSSKKLPFDEYSAPFFAQVGVTQKSSAASASKALRSAGDAMLQAVIYHSDHLELSEQFDGVSGYEKSVKNLTWSYAAFLSAVRAKTGQSVQG